MTPEVVLIQQPAIDFATFLGLSHEALGYSPARACDASHRQLSDAERFLSCLAAVRDSKAPAGLSPSLLRHVSFSVLVAADERDLVDILQAAAGMPFVTTSTIRPRVQLAVVTGTLAQWRDAVVSGTAAEGAVRACYCKALLVFERAGLSHVWHDFHKRTTPDKLFLLEDKRK